MTTLSRHAEKPDTKRHAVDAAELALKESRPARRLSFARLRGWCTKKGHDGRPW